MKLGLAIADVIDAEGRLERRLTVLGERHKADHDVYHLTETLKRVAAANVERLAPHARRYEVDADPGAIEDHGTGAVGRARERASELLGRRPEGGLLLLRDLRELHLVYAEASIDYVILGQGAQAARDAGLLEACGECHQQTLRGMRWTVTRIKTAAPQVLTS